jgi:hypothetical protein
MAVKLPDLRDGRPLPLEGFLILISVRGSVDLRAVVRLEGLGELKTRARDLPAGSILPQPTTLPRAASGTVANSYEMPRNLKC